MVGWPFLLKGRNSTQNPECQPSLLKGFVTTSLDRNLDSVDSEHVIQQFSVRVSRSGPDALMGNVAFWRVRNKKVHKSVREK